MSQDVSSPIFVSYASIDRDVAETICDALRARGHVCWIACRNIGPGENFQESIVRAIRSARVMLLIFTSNANNSDEIKKELVLAGRHRVTVLPVRVEDVAPNDAFAYEFATRQWIDLFKDWEREIDRLSKQIDAIIAAPKADGDERVAAKPTPRPGPAPPPTAQKSSYGPLIAAAIVVVMALCAGGIYFFSRTAPTHPPAAPASSAAVAVTPSVAPASAPIVSPPPAAPVAATPPAPQPVPASQPASSAPTRQFDGAWSITFTCPAAGSALGYSYRVAAQISDGLLHGEKGEKGKPGWLTIDGKIGVDGSLGNVYVDSLVGASQVAIGNVARGTEFGYHVAGKLSSSSGTASRVEGRACTLDFAKQ
jgi:hypothetical protein